MAVGIICEYNPFHNGHLYHLNKIKEQFKNEEIILILGGNFLQRGNPSIIDKYTKTEIALQQGINLIVELPFPFATQGSDIFAKGAITILKKLNCDKLVFGSESADIDLLIKLANIQLKNKEYNSKIKQYLKEGINYPTALSKALKEITGITINTPNDILALSYLKEIKNQKAKIKAYTIKRTNNYHEKTLDKKIASATSIREAIKKNIDIKNYVPAATFKHIKNNNYEENFYKYLKFKIISEKTKINQYQTVDEGIENRIIKNIYESNHLDELITKIKTKRYTYNKINRMFIHILCSFTKKEAKENKNIKYIRILGFDNTGKKYLNSIKKSLDIPIITNINQKNKDLLEIEMRTDHIYNLIFEKQKNIFKEKPIIKKED